MLFGWVARNPSAGRGGAMVVHLVITFLLLGALALAVALALGSIALTYLVGVG